MIWAPLPPMSPGEVVLVSILALLPAILNLWAIWHSYRRDFPTRPKDGLVGGGRVRSGARRTGLSHFRQEKREETAMNTFASRLAATAAAVILVLSLGACAGKKADPAKPAPLDTPGRPGPRCKTSSPRCAASTPRSRSSTSRPSPANRLRGRTDRPGGPAGVPGDPDGLSTGRGHRRRAARGRVGPHGLGPGGHGRGTGRALRRADGRGRRICRPGHPLLRPGTGRRGL